MNGGLTRRGGLNCGSCLQGDVKSSEMILNVLRMMQGKDLVLWNLLTVNIYMQLLRMRPEIAIK